jgi:TRAP-type C4-dicarboxylate transport system substrate-binding protein
MYRRSVLKAATLAPLASPFLNLKAQEVHRLRFSTFMPAVSNVYANIHKPWMDAIEADSQGRIKFEAYPSMQIGGSPGQLFDQAKDGVADISFTISGYAPGRFPLIEAFELPFMTYDGETSSRALWTYFQEHARSDFREVHVLALHMHGLNVVHMRSKLLKTADDFRGMKIRGATRIAAQVISALGAVPVGMPLPQVPDALAKSVIDGAIVPWDTVPPAKLEELTSYHTEFAPGTAGFNNSTQFMVMNKRRYEELPADLKAIMDKHTGLEFSARSGRIIAGGDDPVRQAVLKRGSTVHVMDAAETAKFKARTAPVTDAWIKAVSARGQDGKKLLEAAQGLVEKFRTNA